MEGNLHDYYHILGIPRHAGSGDIHGAYTDAAQRWSASGQDTAASAEFKLIQQAYETLMDEQKRSQYHQSLDAYLEQNGVKLTLEYSRPGLLSLNEPQIIYLIWKIACTRPIPSAVPPLNLCLIIDISTSMQGDRLDMVKANISRLLRQLQPQDQVSVVAFNDRAQVVIGRTSTVELQKIEYGVHMLQASGGTEILKGLQAGLRQFPPHISTGVGQHIILITDGNTYGDEAACLEVARQASIEGITINALGIGHEWNDRFLDQLAGLSGGSTMFISTAETLENYLFEKLKSSRQTFLRGLRFENANYGKAELQDVFRLTPEALPLQKGDTILFGNLDYNEPLHIILEYLVPPTASSTSQFCISAGRVVFEFTKARLFSYPVSLTLPVVEEPLHKLPPEDIQNALAKLTLYRLQERARDEVAAGNLKQATRHLQYLATHLISNGNRALAHTVLVEAENIRQQAEFSKEGDKKIKYATRGLFLTPDSRKVN